jgi:chromatin remodeling complex protein RSC6
MSKNTSAAPASKKVQKKSDVPVETVAAPAVVAPKKAAKPAAAAAAPAPVAAAPVASSVAAPVAEAESKTVEQEISSLIAVFQQQRDASVAAIKSLQRLQKRVAKEVKEASRRKRRGTKVAEDGVVKEKRPTIFTTPVTLKDQLCSFLGKAKGSQMTPADVTRAFSAYVDSHKLKDAEKGHTIHPDEAMRKVLGVAASEVLTYRNIQSYLYKLYVLPEKKAKATA